MLSNPHKKKKNTSKQKIYSPSKQTIKSDIRKSVSPHSGDRGATSDGLLSKLEKYEIEKKRKTPRQDIIELPKLQGLEIVGGGL